MKRNLESTNFILANVAADKEIDLRKLETIVGDKLRFATKEEVLEVTNCEPGTSPLLSNK